MLSAEDKLNTSSKRTILLLSSKGGGGHTAAALTLQKFLGDEYNFHIVHPIDELKIWGVSSGEQLYNKMLQNGWTRSMNFIVRHIAPPIFSRREEKLESNINTAIEELHPDLVISLIPFINYPASEAARKSEIPYLLITTDNDLRHWVLGLEKLKHPDFKVTIGANLATSRDVLLEKNIPERAIETIGLPLRPEFILKSEKTAKTLREEFGIHDEKPITLIMMGGAGAGKAVHFAKKIGEMDLSTHLIVIMGRNESIRKELEKIELNPSNGITLLGFTDRVADLMAIADVIVTKPGPGTINEAIAMHLPILIDNTDRLLFWERVNVDMVLNYGVGQRIKSHKQISDLVETYLVDEEVKGQIKDSFVSIPPNLFHVKIKSIIREMINASHEKQIVKCSVQERPLLLGDSLLPADAL